MAAAPEIRAPDIVDLTRVRVEDIQLFWKTSSSPLRAELGLQCLGGSRSAVRAHQSLSGYALVLERQCRSDIHTMSCEDRKGLIGDLYVMRDYESTANEDLLCGVVQSLIATTASSGSKRSS